MNLQMMILLIVEVKYLINIIRICNLIKIEIELILLIVISLTAIVSIALTKEMVLPIIINIKAENLIPISIVIFNLICQTTLKDQQIH